MEEEGRRPETAAQIAIAIRHRDRNGYAIKAHGLTGYHRGCPCEICVGAHDKIIDMRRQKDEAGGAWDGGITVLESRRGEVRELHAKRLRAAYQMYLDRLPKGFKPINIELWLSLQGDASTVCPDSAINDRK